MATRDLERIVPTAIRRENKRLYPNCAGCIYLDRVLWVCKYCLITKQSRAHSRHGKQHKTYPNGGCDLKSTRPKDGHPDPILTLSQKTELKGRPKRAFDEELALSLYIMGANDTQIALALGVPRRTIMQWRHYLGFPSNYHPALKKENHHECSPADQAEAQP